MNRMKWFCRYAFLGLLLACGVFWSVYCQITLIQLDKLAGSLSFIDMAVDRPAEAIALLARIDTFTIQRNIGLLFCGVMLLCIVALAVFHKLSTREKKSAKLSAAPVETIQESPAEPVQSPPSPASEQTDEAVIAPAEEAPVIAIPEEIPVIAVPEDARQSPEVSDSPEISQPAPADPLPRPVFCTQCGKRYEKKPAFCPQCGARFQ